jgi:hypothetical protein
MEEILDYLSPKVKDHREKENAKHMECYQIEKINWERSNHKCLMAINERILESIRGAIPDCETIVEYLDKVESQFTDSPKAYVITLIKRLTMKKYSEGGVRDHILRMIDVAARLKPLDLAINDGFLMRN